MYYILVMMKTLDRCRNASVSEEFARKRQFVKEWEPRFCWTHEELVVLQTQRRRTDTVTRD